MCVGRTVGQQTIRSTDFSIVSFVARDGRMLRIAEAHRKRAFNF
jgi:hypothetical protein